MFFTDEISEQLFMLGVPVSYLGCRYACCAVRLCQEMPDRLLFVTKWVYPEVAKQYHTNWKAVERDLRTVSHAAWKNNRPRLEKIFHRPLPSPPTVTEFLGALCYTADTPSAETNKSSA